MGLLDCLWPKCSRHGKRFFVLQDCINGLPKLKRFDVYLPAYDSYSHICGNCWREMVKVACDVCGKSFSVLEDRSGEFESNLKKYGITSEHSGAKLVCPKCFTENEHCDCSRCQRPFRCLDDQMSNFKDNHLFEKWLPPNHVVFSESQDWISLCPKCYDECLESCKDVQARLAGWVAGTGSEYVRGYRIVKKFDRVEYRDEDCEEPAQVKEWLKFYSAQSGGNAYVECWVGPKFSEYEETRYGPKGNPYTRTVTRKWYEGYATPVNVEPSRKAGGSQGPRIHRVHSVVIDGLNVCY